MLVQGSNASTALHCVGKLKHLRFLCFKCQRMESLPDSISNLLNLQVLKVNCYGLKELSRDIKHLTDLNHLHFDGVFMTHMPKGIGELKSLQKLPYFVVGKGHQVGGLDELKELNALHGELIISNLVNVESSRVSVSVLKNKPFLQMLTLDWGRVDYWGRMNDADEEILEILCPHPNLKKLKVHGGYGGIKFPNWLSSITNLVELSLKDCKKCEYLPPLHQISFLKELRIVNCPQLKGIKHNNGDDDDDDEEENWPYFHCLSSLEIDHCPNLTHLPLFPTVQGILLWSDTSAQPLVRTMSMKTNELIDDPLSKLTHLFMWEIADLESLPGEYLCNLTSLRFLSIYKCPRLASLPPAMRQLTSLKTVHISDCPQLSQRCQKGVGEDWPNISHTSYAEPGERMIQFLRSELSQYNC
ncbi:Putative disease resistance protein RGA4 [Linum perenne]